MRRLKALLMNVLEGQVILKQGQRAQAARDEQYQNWILQQEMTTIASSLRTPKFSLTNSRYS